MGEYCNMPGAGSVFVIISDPITLILLLVFILLILFPRVYHSIPLLFLISYILATVLRRLPSVVSTIPTEGKPSIYRFFLFISLTIFLILP